MRRRFRQVKGEERRGEREEDKTTEKSQSQSDGERERERNSKQPIGTQPLDGATGTTLAMPDRFLEKISRFTVIFPSDGVYTEQNMEHSQSYLRLVLNSANQIRNCCQRENLKAFLNFSAEMQLSKHVRVTDGDVPEHDPSRIMHTKNSPVTCVFTID